MPRAPQAQLIWSDLYRHYELHAPDQRVQCFQNGDEPGWLNWLEAHASFAFAGQTGRLSLLKETRPRGSGYWYAYQKQGQQTRKRYLGRSNQVTFARLEQVARVLTSQPESASSAPRPDTPSSEIKGILLSSKLSVPRLPTALVERDRLLLCLDGALATPLTLLAAPAGWGKTTLLAAWASRRTGQVAWLSLDGLDNGPSRFWVGLIAALRRCPGLASNVGENVVAQLQSPQPPPLSSCLSVLLHELEREPPPAPIVLILDDYQVIEEPNIHQSMAFFLEHLPTHLHLILASRVDPDLPLARLRVRGQLTEIRIDELRFDQEEASQYLGQLLSPVLSQEEVRKLVNRTEGWIAGLHLAALALQKREDRAAYLEALTGSQRYLLDYVQEDILAYLPENVRDFLLHSAILSRLDASVCQAVTASSTATASQQMLVLLERANLFLVPLDEERRWYRLHGLFREALLSVLHASQPELVPLLHRRAAAFYETEGEWAEAIAHWFEARDFSAATRLMEQTVEQFWVSGEAATMVNWVLALPRELVREHARLMLTTALYLLNTVTLMIPKQRARVYQQVRQLMSQVEAALHGEIDESNQERSVRDAEDVLLRQRLRLLHRHLVLYEAVANGDVERLNNMQQEIEEALNQDEEAIWQMEQLLGSVLLYYTARIEGGRLVPRLLSAREQVDRKASRYASIKIRQWLAQAAVEAGQLHLAYEACQAALDQIEQVEGYSLLKGYPQIVLAMILYQWNYLDEARNLLQAVVRDSITWQHLDLPAWGYNDLLQVELARGDGVAAQQALHEMEQLVQRERYLAYSDHLPIRRAQWWLAQGQLETASAWAASVVFPQGAWEDTMYYAFPVVIRVHFARQRWKEALDLLERWHAHLDRPANIRITITYLAQLLVALHQAGQRNQTRVVAARLFALTEPEGYLRVYLDEGKPMRQALEALLPPRSHQHKLASSSTAYVAKLLAAFEQEQQGVSTSLATSSPAPTAQPIFSVPGTTLTRREHEVLRLLAAGASNQDIAQTLVISLTTVKKHVSNLLGKLGATSRTQAVARARARSLL